MELRKQAWAETKATLNGVAGIAVSIGSIFCGALVGAVLNNALWGGVFGLALSWVGLYLFNLYRAEGRTLRAELNAARAEIDALRKPPITQPVLRDPDGIYQWDGERVGTAQQVLTEIDKGRVTIGLLSNNERWSKDHVFEYRAFKLKFVRCGGGAAISFGSTIGGVDRTHSTSGTLRDVLCTIVG